MYWLLVKDAFSNDVLHYFSMNFTTLETKESEVDKALTPSKLNYKAIVSGKSLMSQVLGSKVPASTPLETKVTILLDKRKSDPVDKATTSDVVLDLTIEKGEAPHSSSPTLGVFCEPPLDPSPVQGIWYAGRPTMSRVTRSALHSPNPSVGFMPIGSEEGYKSDHPYFMDTPYVLTSGVKVTGDSVSRPIHCLAADLLKNCMLRTKAIEAPYAMSFQVTEELENEKSSFGESLRMIREERDSALAEKEKIT
ncbi:hypothetical protein LIER_23937 [Lithospermum erythrorhizon]|uniref:Uncharacterized protein n=1 Tax=Lithospermum erythrorhizon TaxID=34254 RepID=A0AAV3QZI2_LITER